MIWWPVLLAVFGFVDFGHGGGRALADLMLDNNNNNNNHNDNGCPSKCSCLGDYLDCTNIALSTVPVIPAWISSLELSHNELGDDVDQHLGNMTRLKDLKLNKNRLQKFPIFTGLTTLQTLQLSSNKIETIEPVALLALPQLTTLDLSKNSIKNVLPNSFPANNNIGVLNMNNNGIRDLQDDSFENLKNLHDLKLNHNRLGALPARLFRNLRKLKRLELNGNSLSTIQWTTLSNLNKLRVLKLRNNNIHELQTGTFHVLQNLRILELDNNNLSVIQKGSFYNLTTLNVISLSNNTIVKIDQNAWEFCQRLTNIDLSMNKLTVIGTNTFDCLDKLKELNLKHNDISTINEGAFNCTPNLDLLDLSHNQISWTIEDMNAPFSVLYRLDRLYLGENKIKSINKNAFVGLTALTQLDMTSNNITTMQLDAFAKMPALKELLLNTTNLLCDCNMLWFYNCLQAGYYKQVDAMCAYPATLRGRSLQSLSKSNFTCNETPTPRIVESPMTQLAIMARNVTLTCAATSSSSTEMTFTWKRNDVELIADDADISPTESLKEPMTNNTVATSRLQLRNVSHAHAGKYQCTVSNSYGTTYSPKIRITVASFPTFKKIPSNATLNSTCTARLDCAADGDPKPQMAWQKDGGNDFPAARERRMHVMPDDNAFFIVNAKISDQGVYTCTAENPAGIIKANATLTILEPPSFVKPMENKEAIAGISSVLECMASGSPKPSLRWLKDGQPIEVTERHFFAAEDQLLIITGVRDADAGTYTCIMANDLGAIRGIMQLKVAAAPIVVKAEEMTGIVIITVVCCAVGTSIIWVVIIYQTKKGRGCTGYVPADVPPSGEPRQRRYEGNGGNNGATAVRLMAADVSNKIVTLNENDALLDRYTHQKMIVPLGCSVGTGAQHQLHQQLQKLQVGNHSPGSEYNYDDVSCIDSGTGDSAKRSTTDFYSENGTSEMCCIEVDKTSPTVSFKSSPTTTPCHDDDEIVVESVDELDGSDDFNDVTPTICGQQQQNSTSFNDSTASDVNIQTNKLNDFLHHHHHHHHHLTTMQTTN